MIFVGFLLLHYEVVVTSAHFFLTVNGSHGTLGLVLWLIGIHSAATSKWALTKFSISSFGIGVSDISWNAPNLFHSVNIDLSLISLLLSRDQCTVVVQVTLIRRLSHIFAMTIRWSEDTPSKEGYASGFNALLFHLLFIKI